MKQLQLFSDQKAKKFGGELLKGIRKSERPFDSRKCMHLVLRASIIKGQSLRFEPEVANLIEAYTDKFEACLYGVAIVSNHIHFLIKCSNREQYCSFVRATCGMIAAKCEIRWEHRPFTRIVEWGSDFQNVKRYIERNEFETSGLLPYSARSCRL